MDAHRTLEELNATLDHIRQSPKDLGRVEMIVCRPSTGDRKMLDEGRLDPSVGLAGDNWSVREPHPDAEIQLTLMNARAIAEIAQSKHRWPLAGDQLFVDLDLSLANLPPGTRLSVGSAVLRVSAEPHTGCRKFIARFGVDAQKFVNSVEGRRLNLRGINARVITGGVVKPGDSIAVLRDFSTMKA